MTTMAASPRFRDQVITFASGVTGRSLEARLGSQDADAVAFREDMLAFWISAFAVS
jgi:hypothetical protein